MLAPRIVDMSAAVALRKESVDRNLEEGESEPENQMSLSARRAWIEIHCARGTCNACQVALRKESVDRNRRTIKCAIRRISRSPQGERG